MERVTSNDSNLPSIRQRVRNLLKKHPSLTAKPICKQLGLVYKLNESYVKKLRHEWKHDHQNEQGSNRSCPDDVHNAFFKRDRWQGVKMPVELPFGWVRSEAKNGYAVFKLLGLGRIRWFHNGTIELFVRKPANTGRAMQLFCEGFTRTRLVNDIRLVEDFQKGLMRKAHLTFDTGHRLEYMKVTAFEETHKFVFVAGDKTHPTCYEWMMEYQAEVVEARRMWTDLREMFGLGEVRGNGASKPLGGADYST